MAASVMSSNHVTTASAMSMCNLCGGVSAVVSCDDCHCMHFCGACEDMYHRHPKRKFHLRKSIGPAISNRNAIPTQVLACSTGTRHAAAVARSGQSPEHGVTACLMIGHPSSMPIPPPRRKKSLPSLLFAHSASLTSLSPVRQQQQPNGKRVDESDLRTLETTNRRASVPTNTIAASSTTSLNHDNPNNTKVQGLIQRFESEPQLLSLRSKHLQASPKQQLAPDYGGSANELMQRLVPSPVPLLESTKSLLRNPGPSFVQSRRNNSLQDLRNGLPYNYDYAMPAACYPYAGMAAYNRHAIPANPYYVQRSPWADSYQSIDDINMNDGMDDMSSDEDDSELTRNLAYENAATNQRHVSRDMKSLSQHQQLMQRHWNTFAAQQQLPPQPPPPPPPAFYYGYPFPYHMPAAGYPTSAATASLNGFHTGLHSLVGSSPPASLRSSSRLRHRDSGRSDRRAGGRRVGSLDNYSTCSSHQDVSVSGVQQQANHAAVVRMRAGSSCSSGGGSRSGLRRGCGDHRMHRTRNGNRDPNSLDRISYQRVVQHLPGSRTRSVRSSRDRSLGSLRSGYESGSSSGSSCSSIQSSACCGACHPNDNDARRVPCSTNDFSTRRRRKERRKRGPQRHAEHGRDCRGYDSAASKSEGEEDENDDEGMMEGEDAGVRDPESWSCKYCTFINPVGQEICEICAKSRDIAVHIISQHEPKNGNNKNKKEKNKRTEGAKKAQLTAAASCGRSSTGSWLKPDATSSSFVAKTAAVFGKLRSQPPAAPCASISSSEQDAGHVSGRRKHPSNSSASCSAHSAAKLQQDQEGLLLAVSEDMVREQVEIEREIRRRRENEERIERQNREIEQRMQEEGDATGSRRMNALGNASPGGELQTENHEEFSDEEDVSSENGANDRPPHPGSGAEEEGSKAKSERIKSQIDVDCKGGGEGFGIRNREEEEAERNERKRSKEWLCEEKERQRKRKGHKSDHQEKMSHRQSASPWIKREPPAKSGAKAEKLVQQHKDDCSSSSSLLPTARQAGDEGRNRIKKKPKESFSVSLKVEEKPSPSSSSSSSSSPSSANAAAVRKGSIGSTISSNGSSSNGRIMRHDREQEMMAIESLIASLASHKIDIHKIEQVINAASAAVTAAASGRSPSPAAVCAAAVSPLPSSSLLVSAPADDDGERPVAADSSHAKRTASQTDGCKGVHGDADLAAVTHKLQKSGGTAAVIGTDSSAAATRAAPTATFLMQSPLASASSQFLPHHHHQDMVQQQPQQSPALCHLSSAPHHQIQYPDHQHASLFPCHSTVALDPVSVMRHHRQLSQLPAASSTTAIASFDAAMNSLYYGPGISSTHSVVGSSATKSMGIDPQSVGLLMLNQHPASLYQAAMSCDAQRRPDLLLLNAVANSQTAAAGEEAGSMACLQQQRISGRQMSNLTSSAVVASSGYRVVAEETAKTGKFEEGIRLLRSAQRKGFTADDLEVAINFNPIAPLGP